MKTLATCTPREFLKQTARIRHLAADWLDATKILDIRKEVPVFPKDATKEEREELISKQVKQNLSKILDAVLDEHPDETLDLLALMCFIEPKDVDNYTVEYFLGAISELLSNKAVISFFTSLVQLGQMNTLDASKQ